MIVKECKKCGNSRFENDRDNLIRRCTECHTPHEDPEFFNALYNREKIDRLVDILEKIWALLQKDSKKGKLVLLIGAGTLVVALIGLWPTNGDNLPLPFANQSEVPTTNDMDSTNNRVNNEASLITSIINAADSAIIELTQDIQLDSMLVIPSNTSITLTSVAASTHSLTARGNFDAVMVENGATLIIDGIIISRLPNTEGRGVNNWGTLILESGSVSNHINNNDGALGWGGGIINNTGANFTMRSGVISNNTTGARGGGLFNHADAVFVLEGGEISGNTSAIHGGGVYNMGDFTMHEGSIVDNVSLSNGGGVSNGASGNFRITGGEISRNTANSNGGGVNNSTTGVFTMQGAVISDNTAVWGGGVLNWGRFFLHGGQIIENRSDNVGGGVWSDDIGGTFSPIGGQILNNSPDDTNLD